MKTYKIKPEYLHLWGPDASEETTVSESEVSRLASEWGMEVSALLQQLDEVERKPRRIADGWHDRGDTSYLTENGYILRGVYKGKTVYPYRKSRSGGWDNVSGSVLWETYWRSDLYTMM